MNMQSVVEDEVAVAAADGTARAVFCRWTEGRRPGVLYLPDRVGTRQSMREMARRVADEGYNVLLPNIYYRTARPPFFPKMPDFREKKTVARLKELSAPLTPEAMERDGAAYVDFLASRPEVSDAPMGIVGHGLTGAFALLTAAARPDRVGAVAVYNGAGLFTDDSASPHLVLPRVRARLYFGHARVDGGMSAQAVAKLEASLSAWGGRYESERYDALHGWTVSDSGVYSREEAERAFVKLRRLFAATLR
jgi:carboxymethylenebutenolidase